VLADDKFRANFLWGRRPMLAACAARLRERNDLVWVDLGAGTGVSAAAFDQLT
jgi:betaine lipid synthase